MASLHWGVIHLYTPFTKTLTIKMLYIILFEWWKSFRYKKLIFYFNVYRFVQVNLLYLHISSVWFPLVACLCLLCCGASCPRTYHRWLLYSRSGVPSGCDLGLLWSCRWTLYSYIVQHCSSESELLSQHSYYRSPEISSSSPPLSVSYTWRWKQNHFPKVLGF